MFLELLASAVISEAFSADSSLVDFGSLVYLTEAPLPPPGFSKPVRLCSGAVKGNALGGAHGVGEVIGRYDSCLCILGSIPR